MLLNLLHLVAAGLAVFLIGVNVALLVQLEKYILSWFQFKIFGVTALLVYVCLSLVFGGVGLSRTVVGVIALVIDAAAVWRMWSSILTINGGTFPSLRQHEEGHP
jgi:hypothetical protein